MIDNSKKSLSLLKRCHPNYHTMFVQTTYYRSLIFAERDERVVASIPRPRPFPRVTRPSAGDLLQLLLNCVATFYLLNCSWIVSCEPQNNKYVHKSVTIHTSCPIPLISMCLFNRILVILAI